jgi:hypothetical protein
LEPSFGRQGTPIPSRSTDSKHCSHGDHKWLYWLCLCIDMIITLVAVAGVLTLAVLVAYKAVWK